MKFLQKSLQYRQLFNCNRCTVNITNYISQNRRDDDYKNSEYFGENKKVKRLIIGTSLFTVFAYTFNERRKRNVLLKSIDVGERKPDLPYFTMEDVAKHNSKESGVWVTYKEGVYDISNFISNHPGGEQILLAAGSSVEPFWLLYGVHKKSEILELLESMRIGNIKAEDSKKLLENQHDPYESDPVRHPLLKPASVKPFNAEAPPLVLIHNFYTPNDLFYVRNHLPVPVVDPATYELEVEVEGTGKRIVLNLDDIKKLPKHSVSATVMCAGNRRSEMVKIKPVKGLNWGVGAVGNALWTGVRLKDVLKLVDITEETEEFKHVQFEGLDTDPTNTPYGASIPIWKAVDKRCDVILAFEMNGEPIPRDHGFPIRVIVPGVVGARNVKWLGRIVVSKYESDSHWQQNDYKGFNPNVDWDTVDFTKSPAIQELPVISAICVPFSKETVKVQDGHINVSGYAWSGGGQKIVRIDVTVDGGKTWHVANIDIQDKSSPPQHWSWTLWSAQIPVKKGLKEVEIWAKAVDSCYNTQPESFENIWNLRGVLNNAYHRVKVQLKW